MTLIIPQSSSQPIDAFSNKMEECHRIGGSRLLDRILTSKFKTRGPLLPSPTMDPEHQGPNVG